MSASIVWTLVAKDLSLFFRNRFFALITVVGLIFYAVVFFVMPSTVNETIKIGLYSGSPLPGIEDIPADAGVEFTLLDSQAAVRQGVVDGDFVVGVVMPAGFPTTATNIVVYLSASLPDETRDAMENLLGTSIGGLAGQPPVVSFDERIIGPDLVGSQVPPRDRLRPLLAILIIMVETMGMANLISREIERDTIRAVLVTPVTKAEFFTAKGITGTTIALTQAVVLMAVIGGISSQPTIVLVALLLGSAMVTGIGFVIATLGKDILTVMVWGMLVLVVFSVPSFGVMFPGVLSGWVKAIPTYYLVEAIDLSMNFGIGWSSLWDEMAIMLGFDVLALAIGVTALQRKAL